MHISALSNPIPPAVSAGPPPRHLADLLAMITATPLCAPRQAREIASAIRTVGAGLGQPLDRLPVEPASLRRHLALLHPETAGVSAARLANVRSLVKRALTLAGVKAANRPVAEALSTPWQDLFATLPDRYLRSSLAPFARFCTARGIAPTSVSDAISEAYLAHLIQTSLVKKPQTVHQTVCRTWNQAGASVPGWPAIRLTVPTYAQTYSLPLSAFPLSFQVELESYLQRLGASEPVDLLDETAPLRPLRAGSIRTKRYQVRQFASALVLQGMPIAQIDTLAVLTRPATFKLGLRFFLARERRDKDNTRTADQIGHTIRTIGKYSVGLAERELGVLDAITARLTKKATGMTEKNRQRLAQFEDQTVLARFLWLTPLETAKLLRKKQLTRQDCVAFSLLVAFEILLHAPMRVANLAGLRTDQHVRMPRRNDGEAVILLSRSEVKNNEPMQYLLPPEVATLVALYVAKIKPQLETEPSPFLFPGLPGRAKRADTMSKQISRLVRDHIGIAFSPHLMRHLSSKLNIEERPGDYETPRRLLGHKSHDTTYRSYQGLETRSANLLHDELIRRKRAQLAPVKPVASGGQKRPRPAVPPTGSH